MKNTIKLEVFDKLNSVSLLIKQCALEVYKTKDIDLMQETALAAVTHESLCELLGKDGHTDKVIGLINDFGKAVAQLYDNILNFELILEHEELEKPIKHSSFTNKNMLN